MRLFAKLCIAFVALSHVGFLVLEMFFWDHAVGRKIFALDPEFAAASAALAANQGLYNGFLAAGLVWGLISDRRDVSKFFLSCVVVAGVFGAVTAKMSILFVQAMPAAIALVLVYLLGVRNSNSHC